MSNSNSIFDLRFKNKNSLTKTKLEYLNCLKTSLFVKKCNNIYSQKRKYASQTKVNNNGAHLFTFLPRPKQQSRVQTVNTNTIVPKRKEKSVDLMCSNDRPFCHLGSRLTENRLELGGALDNNSEHKTEHCDCEKFVGVEMRSEWPPGRWRGCALIGDVVQLRNHARSRVIK